VNFTALFVHVAAIAAGLFGGLALAEAVAPDLPSDKTKPGVEQPTGGGSDGKVTGSSQQSYYHPGPLKDAIAQTEEQFGAGEQILSLTIEPDRVSANTSTGSNTIAPEDIPVNAPQKMINGINQARQKINPDYPPVTLDDVKTFSFAAANPRDQSWYALLDILSAGPPTEFWGSFNGEHVRLR
jgi:hypothetical protein